jgi:hypothetical protein
MRKLFVLLTILILAFSAFVPMAAAQTTPTESAGCASTAGQFQSGVGPYTFGPYDYLAGEHVVFTFAGAGDSSFSVTVNGAANASGLVPPTAFDYPIPADGSYTFVITVTNGTTGNSASADCLNADETSDYAPGTLCHIPPGNPNAAHTIQVGLPAVEAHLAHGDTEGPCPEGTDTRYDNPSAGVTIFIIYITGEIQVYGNCDDEGECGEVTNVPISSVIDFTIIVVDGSFVEVEDPEDDGMELPDSDTNDGLSVVIYYLHPDPNDSSIGVFQINIYQNGVLVDDSVLLFITTDGTIILWTSHNIWEEQADEAEEDAS